MDKWLTFLSFDSQTRGDIKNAFDTYIQFPSRVYSIPALDEGLVSSGELRKASFLFSRVSNFLSTKNLKMYSSRAEKIYMTNPIFEK